MTAILLAAGLLLWLWSPAHSLSRALIIGQAAGAAASEADKTGFADAGRLVARDIATPA